MKKTILALYICILSSLFLFAGKSIFAASVGPGLPCDPAADTCTGAGYACTPNPIPNVPTCQSASSGPPPIGPPPAPAPAPAPATCNVTCTPPAVLGSNCNCVNPNQAQTQKEATASCAPGKKAVQTAAGWDCKDDGSKAAAAPAPSPGSDMKLVNPLGANATIPGIINKVISTFLGIVGAIALLVFIFGGVVYMTAGGSQKRIDLAKDTLKYAAIGLSIIMFAYVITNSLLYVIAG